MQSRRPSHTSGILSFALLGGGERIFFNKDNVQLIKYWPFFSSPWSILRSKCRAKSYIKVYFLKCAPPGRDAANPKKVEAKTNIRNMPGVCNSMTAREVCVHLVITRAQNTILKAAVKLKYLFKNQ